jgi:hypothetical protein
MNCDNKFGTCCGCPAIINKPREFTQWSNSKLYNINFMKAKGLNNSYDYKDALQNNAVNMINAGIDNFETKYKCKNNKENNIFYSVSTNSMYDGLTYDISYDENDINRLRI